MCELSSHSIGSKCHVTRWDFKSTLARELQASTVYVKADLHFRLSRHFIKPIAAILNKLHFFQTVASNLTIC